MISAIRPYIEFTQLSDTKERQVKNNLITEKTSPIAIGFFGGLCISVVFIASGALLLTSGTLKTLFLAIPLFISAGVIIWMVQRIDNKHKDYDDPIQLNKMREEATNVPLQKTVEEHGWHNIFAYEIPEAKYFHKLFMDASKKMNMEELFDFYSYGAKLAKQSYPSSKLELPEPVEFTFKWKEEIKGFTLLQILDKYDQSDKCSITLLVKEGFIDSSFMDAKADYRHAKGDYQTAEREIQRFDNQLSKKEREEALKKAQQELEQKMNRYNYLLSK